MGKGYTISSAEAAEIRAEMKKVKNKHACRRMEALALLGEGKTPREVAQIKGYNEKYVRTMRSEYRRNGLDAFRTDGRKGGNHVALCDEKAKELLASFEEDAKAGHMITVGAFGKALDEATGKQRVSLSTAYSILHRYGWRKVMPRSRHPKKASDEAIEASKKLTLASRN